MNTMRKFYEADGYNSPGCGFVPPIKEVVPTDWKERFREFIYGELAGPEDIINYIEQNLLSSKEFEGGG